MEEQALVVHQAGGEMVAAVDVQGLIHRAQSVQQVVKSLMKQDVHFGQLPGVDKKTLYQPGAELLQLAFELGPSFTVEVAEEGRGHKTYTATCTLTHVPTGRRIAQALGICSTLEEKYRWVTKPAVCPDCGKEAIIKGRREYGGGYLCWRKKGGCGAKFPDTMADKLQSERVERDSPADVYNTCSAMAQKRAMVRATRGATAASDIFTDSVPGDVGDEGRGGSYHDDYPEPPSDEHLQGHPAGDDGPPPDAYDEPSPPPGRQEFPLGKALGERVTALISQGNASAAGIEIMKTVEWLSEGKAPAWASEQVSDAQRKRLFAIATSQSRELVPWTRESIKKQLDSWHIEHVTKGLYEALVAWFELVAG